MWLAPPSVQVYMEKLGKISLVCSSYMPEMISDRKPTQASLFQEWELIVRIREWFGDYNQNLWTQSGNKNSNTFMTFTAFFIVVSLCISVLSSEKVFCSSSHTNLWPPHSPKVLVQPLVPLLVQPLTRYREVIQNFQGN